MLFKYLLFSFAFLFSQLATAQDAPSCTSIRCTAPEGYFCYSSQYCFPVAEGDSPVRSSGYLDGSPVPVTKWSGISEPFHSPTFTLNISTVKWVPDSGSLDYIWLNPAYLTIEGYSNPFPPAAYAPAPPSPPVSSAPDLSPVLSSVSATSIVGALLAVAVVMVSVYLVFFAKNQVQSTLEIKPSSPVRRFSRTKKQ